MGVPRITRECTTVALQKIDGSAGGFLSWSGMRSTTSVMGLESVLTASLAATSLPPAVPAIRTSAREASLTSWAISSAVGATT